jgi:PAS domain S-box-containing protein
LAEYPDRSQLQQIIAGITEGVILIEPDQAITYANEAALAMHGVASLDELGCSVEVYRQNFVFRYRDKQAIDGVRPPVERVVAGEMFEDVVVEVAHRARPAVDWIHRVRSLVVTTCDGVHDCSVLVITDISAHLAAEERFERMFAANPAPAVICRLSDLRFVKLNAGFIALTGFQPDDVLGRSVYEVDVLANAGQRDLAIRCLKSGDTIPQMEACLRVPRDSERHVIVAGQPLELGAEPCMLFTFADLEDRHKAEMALLHSEERFAKSFRLSPVPTAVCTVQEHRFADVNEAFVTAMGYGVDEAIGRTADDLMLWADSAVRRGFEADLAKTGSVRGFEAKFHPKGGGETACLVSAETVTINDALYILCAFQDITERKRTESELVTAIEAAMADSAWFSRGVMEKLAALRQLSGPAASSVKLDDLTRRERDIVALICRGAGDAEISRELNLSPHTVRNHVASVYRKLGVNRRSAVVIWARERGVDGGAGKPVPPGKGSTKLLA